MIRLDEVAKKIENILNGVDTDIESLNIIRPTDFIFRVQTEGFHLDNIKDIETRKNFIPVFISSMGGNFNPVSELLQATYIIPISIYFPVRLKEDMFATNEYLAKCFVGRYLNYGPISGKCISNISVAQFGEIQDLDLKQFQAFVEKNYKQQIEVMEPYLSMQINLYLTNTASDFIYGNSVKYVMKFDIVRTVTKDLIINLLPYRRNYHLDTMIDGQEYYGYSNGVDTYYTKNYYFGNDEPYYSITDNVVTEKGTGSGLGEQTETISPTDNLIWASSGTGANNSPIAQQLIDEDAYSKNVINITSYNKSIIAYIKNTPFWRTLLDYYNKQKLNELSGFQLIKRYEFNNGDVADFTYNQLILSLNENIAKGELLSMTIVFGDEYIED